MRLRTGPITQGWNRPDTVRDITIQLDPPELPSPAFALTEQPEFEAALSPWLDGKRYRYSMDVHFDHVTVQRDGAKLDIGRTEAIRFSSDAASFDDFRRHFHEAIRNYLQVVARRAGIARAIERRRAKKKGK